MTRINRFIGNFNIALTILVVRDKKQIHQIRDVLRLKVGDTVVLSDGVLHEAEYTLHKVEKDYIECVRNTLPRTYLTSSREITLACAILKRNNFELVVQKAAEIGITCIIPIHTAHTVKTNLSLERLRVIAQEAVEQSGQNKVLTIQEPILFTKVIENIEKDTLSLFCDFEGKSFLSVMHNVPKNKKIILFVGPEGGWSNEERVIAKEKNMIFVMLGHTTLRAETAAIVASYCAVTCDAL